MGTRNDVVKTKKQRILEWVEKVGGATYSQIIRFAWEYSHPGESYNWRKHRGYYSSFFSPGGMYTPLGSGLTTCRNSGKFLIKKDGKYYTKSGKNPNRNRFHESYK